MKKSTFHKKSVHSIFKMFANFPFKKVKYAEKN